MGGVSKSQKGRPNKIFSFLKNIDFFSLICYNQYNAKHSERMIFNYENQ